MTTLLDIQGLTIQYGAARALDDVSLVVDEGEIVGIVGESGSGKTTLALAIMGLLPRQAHLAGGHILFRGKDLTATPNDELRRLRGPELAMVFQNPRTSFDPLRTIEDHLFQGLLAHSKDSAATMKRRAYAALRDAELPSPDYQARRYPHELSGGMRQRSLIALALENQPELIIADEPTTALDVTIQAQILDLMRRLAGPGDARRASLMLVSHNLGVVRTMCSHVVVMYGGRIVEQGPIDDVFAEPRHPYTRALLLASPRLSKSSIDPGIPGEPVDITSLPAGCAFAPRCQFRLERCEREMPPLRDLGGRSVRCWVGELGPLGTPPAPSDVAPAATHSPLVRGTADDDQAMVEIEHVSKVFPVAASGGRRRVGRLTAVRDVTLRIAPGETLAIVGESGSGKSTLGRLLLGLSKPTSGSIRVEGADPVSPRSRLRAQQRLQAVFQDPNSSLDPRMTVRDAVDEPLRNLGWDSARRRARVEELLSEVRLPLHFLGRYPRQLSGGQAQRVAIARALAPNPSLVVLDEPTASLDVSIQAYVLRLLADLRARHGLTYLFISHDLAAVRVLATRIAVMYLGGVVEEGSADDVFSAPQHPYTAALLSALPDIDVGSGRARIILSGEQPSPIDAPSGCPFRTRCPIAQAICATDAPLLLPVAGSHRAACHFPGQLSSVAQPLLPTPDVGIAS